MGAPTGSSIFANMLTRKPATIDEYIGNFPGDTQVILEHLREVIRKAAPRAEETISYGIPCFKLNGTYLVYFGGYKHHVSLYPIPKSDRALLKVLEPHMAGKGTLRFALKEKMPFSLMTRIVKASLKDNASRARAKRR